MGCSGALFPPPAFPRGFRSAVLVHGSQGSFALGVSVPKHSLLCVLFPPQP